VIICKTDREIEAMREAGRIVGQTLRLMGRLVEPGISTGELDAQAEGFIRKRGAVPTFKGYQGFPGSVCVSINEQVVHGIPSGRKLKDGDIVSIDCGATLNGYIGDAAVTLLVGKVSPRVVELVETTHNALQAAIGRCVVGVRLGDISHSVETVARKKGYGVVREYCGHGVGTELHEAPQVPNYGRPGYGPVVTNGWTIAIEPMLNLGGPGVAVLNDGWTVVTSDGRPSAHFEHSVAITDAGTVILTLP
jgi:methionyl aminopeptidase